MIDTSFKPWQIYRPALPVLKVGYKIKIGDKFYIVKAVRGAPRRKVPLTAGKTDEPLDVDKGYISLVGKLDMNRIIHIQYVSADSTDDAILKWMTEPLFSKDERPENLPINSVVAPLDVPVEVDRWSYQAEMHLKYTLAADKTQNLYFGTVEYTVVPYTGAPPKRYLEIFPDGQAEFVEAA